MMKSLFVVSLTAMALMALLTSGKARAQDLFLDYFRESVDEARLRQDYRAFQRDLANGNSAGAQYDLLRIQQDSVNLARDQAQLNYDLGRGAPPIPYQYYGNGYSANTAAQSYFVPLQVAPLNPVPSASGPVPNNPPPALTQVVKISNPDVTGVTLAFVFGGNTYSIESGQIREFNVATPTQIAFSRGGSAGVARYTLAGGHTFEFKYDDSGWSMVQKRVDLATRSTEIVPQNPVPKNLVPPLLNSVAPGPAGGTPTLPGPGPMAP